MRKNPQTPGLVRALDELAQELRTQAQESPGMKTLEAATALAASANDMNALINTHVARDLHPRHGPWLVHMTNMLNDEQADEKDGPAPPPFVLHLARIRDGLEHQAQKLSADRYEPVPADIHRAFTAAANAAETASFSAIDDLDPRHDAWVRKNTVALKPAFLAEAPRKTRKNKTPKTASRKKGPIARA